MDNYQKLAARTIAHPDDHMGMEFHALHGMISEIGELHGLYQKVYQGHEFNEKHAKKELGDLMWFIAEYCTSQGWKMSEIAQLNIDKLKARFPDGFSEEKSKNRKKGDV